MLQKMVLRALYLNKMCKGKQRFHISFLLSKFMPFTLDNTGSYITHCSITPSGNQH